MNQPKKIPKRTPPRLLRVLRSESVTPNLQRIVLGGSALQGFPLDRNGAHIKVFLPREGQLEPVLPTLGDKGIIWPPNDIRPITRTYSVRRYRPESSELEVDFVLHGDVCPASGWAERAKEGDMLGIAGPGGPYPLIQPSEWHFIAGDMTALPAISALLEDLPAGARGQAFIEISNKADEQVLINNTQIDVTWLYRGQQGQKDIQLEAIKKVIVPSVAKTVSAFIAGENSAVISIRDYLRSTYGLTKSNLYAVPYWRRGQDEETYHQERHRVMDQVY